MWPYQTIFDNTIKLSILVWDYYITIYSSILKTYNQKWFFCGCLRKGNGQAFNDDHGYTFYPQPCTLFLITLHLCITVITRWWYFVTTHVNEYIYTIYHQSHSWHLIHTHIHTHTQNRVNVSCLFQSVGYSIIYCPMHVLVQLNQNSTM